MNPHVETFHDPRTATLTHLVWAPTTGDAVLVDPVLDYAPENDAVSGESIDRILEVVRSRGLRLCAVLETHVHADHLTGAAEVRRRLGVPVLVGERIVEVQKTLARKLGLDVVPDGHGFDRLVKDGERLVFGALELEAIATPGHTPACVSYVAGDAVFTGDALFLEDVGTGRCDFPGGSADALYGSVAERLYALRDSTRVFPGHDYPPARALRTHTTVGVEKASNVHLDRSTTRAAYVELREARDRGLAPPRLFAPSLRANLEGGRVLGASSGV